MSSLLKQCLYANDGDKKVILSCDGGGMRCAFTFKLCFHMRRSTDHPLTELFSMAIGTSAGAMVASAVALGIIDDAKTSEYTLEEFYNLIPPFFSDLNKWGPMLAPKYKGDGKRKSLQKFFGNKTFADAKIPLVILCASWGGEIIPYCSWQEQYSQLKIFEVLDACSAVPTYFPPIYLNHRWLFDAGVVGNANKPLINTLLIATKFFDRANLHFLSIGTAFDSPTKLEKDKVQKTGVLWWVMNGIVECLQGTKDTTSQEFMTELFGEKFLRLECPCSDIRMDNFAYSNWVRLITNADFTWKQQGKQIVEFLSNNDNIINQT